MTAVTTGCAHSIADQMQRALDLPSGARFYRCALQVNPFAYLERHSISTAFRSEDEYNSAIVETCLDTGIEVIAVTDHYRVKHSASLVHAARRANLHAFSGFEAVTKDGVHFLCLFDPDKDERLERYIGNCGIHETSEASPIGNKDSVELLEAAREWGAVCIAAHAASTGGLLKKLSGKTRINAWRHPDLHACALPGPVDNAPDGIKSILQNRDDRHRRQRPVAILNASDVNGPDDLKKTSVSCCIKMSSVSVEAFRQAFLDPDSRIRLHSDPEPDPHAEFLAMGWEGGFLHDTFVHFNENLNVLVGGRGAGKSTMIESIRYVLGLDPLGDDARKMHQGMIKHVLQPGTRVSLLVRSHKPSRRCYTIERTVPNPPVVRDHAGDVLTLSPSDVMPGVEVFGQHEISELTKSPVKRTRLLERFVERDPTLSGRKSQIQVELDHSRRRIVDTHRELERLEERVAALPGLEEMQMRFQQAGLEERLKEKSQLVREERLFDILNERIKAYSDLKNELIEELPVDTALVSSRALEGLPNADTLSEIEGTLEELGRKLNALAEQFGAALTEACRGIAQTRLRWGERRIAIEERYEDLLRELQKSRIDGSEFIQLREQIEELRPLNDRMERLRRERDTHKAQRIKLLIEWEDLKASEYRQVNDAARHVSGKLRDRVDVSVTMAGNRESLEDLLREVVGGHLKTALRCLHDIDQLSLRDLAQRCREGKESLISHYGLPSGAAERIAKADRELFMRIEELELPPTTEIKLNTAPDGEPANWQRLETLSTGQKATAALLLLLLESNLNAPLVVDQPEDDLDNRFVTEGVVPIMRKEKHCRQFIFSTHNANIPVLGDAELILGLTATGGVSGQARIASEHMASIDSGPVRELVEEILEGGKDAFEMRRSKYGF